MTEARLLLDLIARAIVTLQEIGAECPVLNDPSHPELAIDDVIQVQRLASTVSAAALQLAAIFEPPQISVLHVASGALKTAALRVCLEGNVTEILREAGPQGLHVREIAAFNGLDPKTLARLLRYLASFHVYREVSPDTFANNRISAVMDTGKSVVELFRSPGTKHDNTNGFPAFLSHQMDEVSKAAAYSWEAMTDPRYPSITPLEKALLLSERGGGSTPGAKPTFFDFLQRPEQTHRHRRFAIAMEGMAEIQPLDCLSRAYDWDTLPANALVVDVGGGVGTVSLELVKRFPKLKFVIQDLSSFIEKGKILWSERQPGALESGRVIFQAHDFFTPQPQKEASIFLLRHVIHNWSDDDCIKILSLLRNAARDDTRLLILEIIMPHACRRKQSSGVTSKTMEIPGAAAEEAPVPLLPNFGAASEFAHVLDMTMFSILKGASERTIDQFSSLLFKSGWNLIKVNRLSEDVGMWQAFEAIPFSGLHEL